MRCVDCEKHSFVANTHWCDATKKPKRVSDEDAHKDAPCKHGQQRKVICVDDGTVFGSYNEAGKHYGISPMTVKSCCERKSKGKVKTFRYADGEREGE